MKRTTIYVGMSLALSVGLLLALLWLLGGEIGASVFTVHAAESAKFTTMSIQDGLVAHYPFNGNANDESGNGNDCTVDGATLTTDRFGNPNSAYSFDGSNDYISRPYSATNGLHPTEDPFAVSAWFKTSASSPDEQVIVSTHYAGAGDGYHLAIDSYNEFHLRCFFSIYGSDVPVFSTDSVNDGVWHHAVCMWKDDVLSLYIDTVLQDSTSAVGTVAYGNQARFEIGHCDNVWFPDSKYYFNGSIDAVRIYNRGLTAADIQALYYEGLTGPVLVPATQFGYEDPGGSVVYEERLVNATGQTDSFDLSLLPGNAWTTTLSLTNTGPLSDGAWISFTLQVTVPVSASPGDKDMATIRATSVASPTVYDTATIQTFVMPVKWYVSPGGSDGNDCHTSTTPCATINGVLGRPGFVDGATVLVAAGTYTDTGGEVVLLDKDVTLSGGWDAGFGTQSGTSVIDGEGSRRGVTVNGGATVTVDRFTIQDGYTDDAGGGIYNNDGVLTLTHSVVCSNTADGGGGGIALGFGSWAFISDAQIYANSSANGSGGGVGAENGGNLNLSRSWVVANVALNNDAGGIAVSHGSAYIENSIIAGNVSASSGDAGGGLYFGDGGPYHIVNSHIVGNQAYGTGAAIATYDPVQVELTNTLIISNTGDRGITDKYGNSSVFLLSYCDTYGNSPDGTSVVISRTNCLGSPPEDGLDPLMAGGALPSGVGPAFAAQWLSYDYRLQPGSPAIDAGTPIGAPATDIRGIPRDAAPDIGAYEFSHMVYLPLVLRNYP